MLYVCLLYGVMPQVVGSKTIVQWIQLSVELLLTFESNSSFQVTS